MKPGKSLSPVHFHDVLVREHTSESSRDFTRLREFDYTCDVKRTGPPDVSQSPFPHTKPKISPQGRCADADTVSKECQQSVVVLDNTKLQSVTIVVFGLT